MPAAGSTLHFRGIEGRYLKVNKVVMGSKSIRTYAFSRKGSRYNLPWLLCNAFINELSLQIYVVALITWMIHSSRQSFIVLTSLIGCEVTPSCVYFLIPLVQSTSVIFCCLCPCFNYILSEWKWIVSAFVFLVYLNVILHQLLCITISYNHDAREKLTSFYLASFMYDCVTYK